MNIEKLTATIPVEDYTRDYRDIPKFAAMCKQCRRYGNTWSCPPYDFDIEAYVDQYKTAVIFGHKIICPQDTHGLSVADACNQLIAEARLILDEEVIQKEKELNGRGFLPGSCRLCEECTRVHGDPCIHPDRVRPSLEACGFDISKTSSELLKIPLKWGSATEMPEYLVLVSAVMYGKK